jgi:hypothetical protein
MKFNKLALCLEGKAINGLGQVAGTSNITGDRHLSYISHRSQQPYQSSQ